MKNFIALFWLLAAVSQYPALKAQDAGNVDTFLECVEQYYGTSDLLVNGRPYVPINLKAKGFPYFKFNTFSEGILYVKDRVFTSVLLKYNVEKDQLILKENLVNNIPVQVVLTTALIDSFQLGNHLFFNRTLIFGEATANGFLEVLYNGDIQFYKKHTKLFHPTFSQVNPHGKYHDDTDVFYLKKAGKLHEIKSKKQLLEVFADQKKAVKKFMKQNGIKFKKANNNQFYNLLKYCDEFK